MLARLSLLFIVVPLLELVLLVQLGRWVGLWPTLLLVLGTGVVGAALARSQGMRTLASLQRELAQGRLPTTPLLDGLAIFVGGAFLLTPGLLTDLTGFALLVPMTRRWIRGAVTARLSRMKREGTLQVGVFTPFGMSFGSGFPGSGSDPDSHDAGSGHSDTGMSPSARAGLDPRNEIDPTRR